MLLVGYCEKSYLFSYLGKFLGEVHVEIPTNPLEEEYCILDGYWDGQTLYIRDLLM